MKANLLPSCALALLTACGGAPALQSAERETAGGTTRLDMLYEGGRVVGATVAPPGGDEVAWVIEVDDRGRLLRRNRDDLSVIFEIAYEGDTAVTRTTGFSGKTYTLDDDRITAVEGEDGFYQARLAYDRDVVTMEQLSTSPLLGFVRNTIIKGGDGCGLVLLERTPIPEQVRFECDGENSLLERGPVATSVRIDKDDEGRAVVVEITDQGASAERWTLTWRDDGALGPRLKLGARVPAGAHIDGRGEFSRAPGWLDLNLGVLLGAGNAFIRAVP